MGKCDKFIETCIKADCKKPPFTGVEEKAWIFNRAEWLEPTWNASNPNLIDAINLADGATGYTVNQLGKTPYTGTTVELVEGAFGNTFTSTVQFLVPDNSAAASSGILDQLAGGKFVMILANSYAGSDSKSRYQVFGVNKGLSCTAMTNDKYNADALGGWQVTLTEEAGGGSAYFLYHETQQGVDDTLDYIGTKTDNCGQDENNG
jgi:hypothetical protein